MISSPKKRYSLIGVITIIFITITISTILLIGNSQKSDLIYNEQVPENEEVLDPATQTIKDEAAIKPEENGLLKYVTVINGCDLHFGNDCLLVRSGPGQDHPIVARLRNGIVLKVTDQFEQDNITWYKVVFDEWLRYPERLTSDWYIAADYVEVIYDQGDLTIWENTYSTTSLKKIVIDQAVQKLFALEDETIVMEFSVSTGLELTPTPRGSFAVFKKTPSRYMQGPIAGLADQQIYDLPGVPWNLYFTQGGAVIHGTYWHDSFGQPYSHGCVNLSPSDARKLYAWAEPGTKVIVKN